MRLTVSREIIKYDETYESILKDPQPIYCKLIEFRELRCADEKKIKV